MATEVTTTTTTLDPIALIQRSTLGEATKTKYTSVLQKYLDSGSDLSDPGALKTFADQLPNSRRAQLKAAIRLWSREMTTMVKGQATPENIGAVQASVARFEALTEAIKVKHANGSKVHVWLSKREVKSLSNTIQNGIVGARDRVAIGLLVAAGLRREEAVTLTFDDIKYLPVGDKMRAVLAVKGKGAKGREVPISDKLAADLDKWGEYVGRSGRVVRGLGRLQTPTDSMSAVALFNLVRKYGARINKPDLAPHDLRRTYAQIAYQDGIDIGQISKLLGHESIKTTQTYLGIDVDRKVTASDFIPW